ncbi:MAG TPA: ChbG/HpnK family deacetylase, partial [Thermoanaerobaculia bacterium]|nr:ChbG/HpnK family deacetylase [Thermoanaerobaculia bacterium]
GLPARAPDDATRRLLREARVRTPDRFEDGFHGDGVRVERLARILEELPDGVTELMCHPAVVDDALREGSRYAGARDLEREILCDPAIRELVRSRRIRLAGFEALAARMR